MPNRAGSGSGRVRVRVGLFAKYPKFSGFGFSGFLSQKSEPENPPLMEEKSSFDMQKQKLLGDFLYEYNNYVLYYQPSITVVET